jgi:hypothetical protein
VPFEGDGTTSIAGAQQALGMSVEMIDDDVLIKARLNEW